MRHTAWSWHLASLQLLLDFAGVISTYLGIEYVYIDLNTKALNCFRAKNLKFYAADTTDLNDILLRVSAFGLFVYALFSIIAGARYALVKEQNLLVLVTGAITVFQVNSTYLVKFLLPKSMIFF